MLGNPTEDLARLSLPGFSPSYCTEEFFFRCAATLTHKEVGCVLSVCHPAVSPELFGSSGSKLLLKEGRGSRSLRFHFSASLTTCWLSPQ